MTAQLTQAKSLDERGRRGRTRYEVEGGREGEGVQCIKARNYQDLFKIANGV